MIEDGLFEKFPCDAVFAIHNKPGVPVGHIVTKPGPLLAAADRWDIRIAGKGGHAAHPHLADRSHGGRRQRRAGAADHRQPATSIRSTPPWSRSASSRRGSAYNVIPADVHIGGTTRTTTPANRELVKRRIEEICRGAEQMHGVKIEVEHRPGYPPTVNNEERVRFALDVAAGVCGDHAVSDKVRPQHGRGGFLLHAGEGAGRHGDAGQRRRARGRSACTTRATTSTTWRSCSASASSCAPSSASSSKQA